MNVITFRKVEQAIFIKNLQETFISNLLLSITKNKQSSSLGIKKFF